jgi:hypothetical protein
MRFSAAISETIGTTLEVGARRTKTQAGANAATGRRNSAASVAAPAAQTTASSGRAAPSVRTGAQS